MYVIDPFWLAVWRRIFSCFQWCHFRHQWPSKRYYVTSNLYMKHTNDYQWSWGIYNFFISHPILTCDMSTVFLNLKNTLFRSNVHTWAGKKHFVFRNLSTESKKRQPVALTTTWENFPFCRRCREVPRFLLFNMTEVLEQGESILLMRENTRRLI